MSTDYDLKPEMIALEEDSGEEPQPVVQREAVLFVDDETHILSSIRRLIRPLKLKTYFAESGAEGLKILEENHVDLVVSDMRMPEMDGAEFLTKVKAGWPNTVRVLLTGYSDISSTIDALNNGGIYRYISKPWEDDELKEIVLEALKLKRLEREREELTALTQRQNSELQDLNQNLEKKVAERTEEIKRANARLDAAYSELQENYDSFVHVFSNIINDREELKKAESKIVADLAQDMAKALKLKPDTVRAVYHAGLLHQLGKMSLPDALISTPEDEMSAEDLERYHDYPVGGEAALTAIHGLDKASKFIRNHTELCNGSGYPDGLSKETTLAGARILRVARDYIGYQTGILSSNQLNGEEAMEKMQLNAGILYDQVAIKVLKHFHRKYDISALYRHEETVGTGALKAGMRLTKDLINTKGTVLVAKGHRISEPMIHKIRDLEALERTKYELVVASEQPPAN